MSLRRLNAGLGSGLLIGLLLPWSLAADEVDVRLAKAKTSHARELEAALETLNGELADHIAQLAKTGDYEVVKAAAAERDLLDDSGILPASESTSPCVERYLSSRRNSNSLLYGTYRESLAELTKNLRLDQAEQIDKEMKAFVELERSLLAARRVRPETPEAETADRSPDKVRAEVLRARHVRTCRELAETFAELERAVTASKALDTTTRQYAAHSSAVAAATEKVRNMEFELCYRIDDVKLAESDRWTMLVVSMDYRPEIVEHVPMSSFPESIRVSIPRNRAGEISPGTYVHLKGLLGLKSSTMSMASEPYYPRAVYYKCAANERWYSAYMDVRDFRIVKAVPSHLVAEADAKLLERP